MHAKAGPSQSSRLRLAPNLDPRLVEPSLLELRHVSDLREHRELLIGKLVMVTGGAWKSYIGTVKTTAGPGQYLVQLDSPSRKILVGQQELGLIQ